MLEWYVAKSKWLFAVAIFCGAAEAVTGILLITTGGSTILGILFLILTPSGLLALLAYLPADAIKMSRLWKKLGEERRNRYKNKPDEAIFCFDATD